MNWIISKLVATLVILQGHLKSRRNLDETWSATASLYESDRKNGIYELQRH